MIINDSSIETKFLGTLFYNRLLLTLAAKFRNNIEKWKKQIDKISMFEMCDDWICTHRSWMCIEKKSFFQMKIRLIDFLPTKLEYLNIDNHLNGVSEKLEYFLGEK